MEHKIKKLAEAVTKKRFKNLILTHTKDLNFNQDRSHLVIHLDNAGPLHALSEKEGDHSLKKALEQVYGGDITYELKLYGKIPHEREKQPGAGWGRPDLH